MNNRSESKNKLSNKQFFIFAINYVIGFGFIATISQVIEFGIWGILIFALTTFIGLSVALVFARASYEFKDEMGGSYVYAKKTNNKLNIFFQGWNQYMQGPIIGASKPLFVSTLLITLDSKNEFIYILLSLIVFILITIATTFNLQKFQKIWSFFALIKWIILLLAVFIVIYYSFSDLDYKNNFGSQTSDASIYNITSTILYFIFAFGGVESIAVMSTDVKTENIKGTILKAFGLIAGFYFVFYFMYMGVSITIIDNDVFKSLFNASMGVGGIVFYTTGMLSNQTASTLASGLTSSRTLIPMSYDGLLPKSLSKKDSNGNYKNAIIFSATLTIASMLIFQIPYLVTKNNYFIEVIKIGTIAFLIQYVATILTILHLERKNKIGRINIIEKIIYIFVIALISFILISQIIPPVVGQKWNIDYTIRIIAYFAWMLFGALIMNINLWINKKNQLK